MRFKVKALVVALLASKAAGAGAFELTPIGRLHLDYASHDSDKAQFVDRFIVRRAQIGLDAEFDPEWSAKVVYEFARHGAFKDAYLRYSGWKPAEIIIGQVKVPFGLEELINTNNITFIERSLPTEAFPLSRRKGVRLENLGTNHTFSLMQFGSSISGDEGSGTAARFTLSPVNHDDSLVHLGLAATTERPNGGVKISVHPEALPTDKALLKTGTVTAVNRINQLGLEGAWKQGPFSVQSEWMHSHLSRDSNQPDVDYQGWYMAGSWILTGESRGYRDGVFKGIKAAKPTGAWEVTTRFSHLNLDDGLVRGGQESNVTLGVNWYARRYVRVMANYIKVTSRRRYVSDDPTILDVRLQVEF